MQAMKVSIYQTNILGAVVVDKQLEENSQTMCFDAARGKRIDMIKEGVIDPTKVINKTYR